MPRNPAMIRHGGEGGVIDNETGKEQFLDEGEAQPCKMENNFLTQDSFNREYDGYNSPTLFAIAEANLAFHIPAGRVLDKL